MSFIGLVLTVPPYLTFRRGAPLAARPYQFAWQAVGGAVRRLGVSQTSIFPALVPGATTALGIPVLGEVPTRGQVADLAAVTLGLLLVVGGVAPDSRRWHGSDSGPRP